MSGTFGKLLFLFLKPGTFSQTNLDIAIVRFTASKKREHKLLDVLCYCHFLTVVFFFVDFVCRPTLLCLCVTQLLANANPTTHPLVETLARLVFTSELYRLVEPVQVFLLGNLASCSVTKYVKFHLQETFLIVHFFYSTSGTFSLFFKVIFSFHQFSLSESAPGCLQVTAGV